MTIEDYLKGKVGFDITDQAISAILLDRDVQAGTLVGALTAKQKDLIYADALMWGATRPSTYTGARESDGGWSQSSSSSTMSKADKERLESMARDIYDKYGDSRKAKAKVRIVNLYGYGC